MSKIIKTGELDYASAFISSTDDSGNTVEKKLFAPIFRVKNAFFTRANDMSNFLNFTVYWESSLGYSVKTYSINVIITSGGGYRYIFKDETPDNAEFEVVALSDGEADSYTTYYVTFPNILQSGYNIYDGRCAQIVVNKSDLIENIEFLGARPFDVDITATTLNVYSDTPVTPIVLPEVTITAGTADTHLIDTTYLNQAFFNNNVLYVDYGIYARNTESVVGDISGALKINGITPTKALRFIVPYTSTVADSGICTFIVNTDGTIDIKNSQKRMQARLQFVLDESYYKISNEK